MVCRDCDKEAMPGKVRCEEHLAARAVAVSQSRARAIEAGVCARCYTAPKERGHYCGACYAAKAEKDKVSRKARYVARRAARQVGECLCGSTADPGLRSCSKCRDGVRARQANRRDRLRSLGLCWSCRGPLGDGSTSGRCEACTGKVEEARRRRTEERLSAGLCRRCGATAVEGKQLCSRHSNLNKISQMKAKYGITNWEVADMLRRQGGTCAICCRPPAPGQSLHIDHDHGTGSVRGLLCSHCNTGIGLFCDSPDILRKAAQYVYRPTSSTGGWLKDEPSHTLPPVEGTAPPSLVLSTVRRIPEA